jgi:hypothetical protein
MSHGFRPCPELEKLAELALTEHIDEPGVHRLEAMLRADTDALRWYRDMVSLQVDLRVMMTASRSNQQALAHIRQAKLDGKAELDWKARVDWKAEADRQPLPLVAGKVPPPRLEPSGTDRSRSNRAIPSPVLGFLNGLLRIGAEASPTNALMWLVMAIVCSGMVLTVFFCSVLMFHGLVVHVHLDPAETAQQSLAQQGMDRGSPRPSGVESQQDSAGRRSPVALGSSAAVARLIRADDCHWAIGSHSPHLGDDLEPGRKLVLLSGLAEVMFQSGVRGVLEGPANLEISTRKGALLRQGKLTVRVEDPDARGFEVRTPGMKFTDLGTEFGVSVAKDGTQEMIVFRGEVRAEVEDADAQTLRSRVSEPESRISNLQSQISRPPPIRLTANEAIRVSASDKSIARVAVDENLFVRAAMGPEAFPIFGTGIGFGRGAADTHWEIADISTDPDFKPRPASVLLKPVSTYVADASDKGQWISLAAEENNYPGDCRWTFRTKFDLSGFDARTACIEGQFAVDNYVEEIRLNGRRLPVVDSGEYTRYHPILIERGFVAGENTLELVVKNLDNFGQGGNMMALCVQWKGTARKALKRG